MAIYIYIYIYNRSWISKTKKYILENHTFPKQKKEQLQRTLTYIEFARKVCPVRVSPCSSHRVQADQIVESFTQFSCINHLLVVDSGKWTSNHVTNVVECRLKGSLISGVQSINDSRCIFELDPAKLNVLASCDINHTLLWSILFHGLEALVLSHGDGS